MLTAPLVVLGQLFAVSFAAGLNLYLTLALIGLTSRLGLIPALPPGLTGLENTVLIGSASLLYLVEFWIDKVPHADSVWDALHTVIRPVATAMLAALALSAAIPEIQILAALLAGLVALSAHGSKAGLRIIVNLSPSPMRSRMLSTLEDLLAAALAILALRFPVGALAVGSAIVLLLALTGPRLWRAGALAVRALRARFRAFFGSRGWRSINEVPLVLRSLVEPAPPGRAEPRAIRAAVNGLPGVGAYRNGWLVVACDGSSFLYRSLGRPRRVALHPAPPAIISRGLWTDTLEFRNGSGSFTIFLMKDGPAPDLAAADLTPGGA